MLDPRGPAVAAAVLFATGLYHWEPAAMILGIFAYTLFFYPLIGLRWKRAARLGFGFGAGLAALNLRWLVAEFDAHWAGLVLFMVSIYGGVFMAVVAALLRSSLVRRPGSLGLILTALVLPAADYVRTITPRFGIGNLHSAHLPVANLDIAQAAHWVGAGGLSALMAFCSYAAANWLFHERKALRTRPRSRILVSGVMEFWSTGVLRTVGIAPRVRGVGGAFRAAHFLASPRAEALGYDV